MPAPTHAAAHSIQVPAAFVRRPKVVSLREKAARNIRLGCGNHVALTRGLGALPRTLAAGAAE